MQQGCRFSDIGSLEHLEHVTRRQSQDQGKCKHPSEHTCDTLNVVIFQAVALCRLIISTFHFSNNIIFILPTFNLIKANSVLKQHFLNGVSKFFYIIIFILLCFDLKRDLPLQLPLFIRFFYKI